MNIFDGYKTADWTNLTASPTRREDEILSWSLPKIIARCYDLDRNYPIAANIANIYNEYVSNVGCVLNSDSEVEKIWAKFARNATIRGEDYTTGRKTRIKEGVVGGGCLVLFVYDRNKNLKLDFVPSGSVKNPRGIGQGSTNGRGFKIFNGIAYDAKGREVGYHYEVNGKMKYVSRFNSMGEFNAYFERNAMPMRAGQSRTLPLCASSIIDIEDYTLLGEYVVSASKNAATMGAYIVTSDPELVRSGLGMVRDDNTTDTVEVVKGNMQMLGENRPEMIGMLPAGTDVRMVNPQGNFAYRELLELKERNICANVGLNEQLLTKNTQGSNFATAKFSGQSAVKTFRSWGEHYNTFDSIVMRRVLVEATLEGSYSGEINISHSWMGDVNFDEVDAQKTANASKTGVEAGITSRSIEAAKKKLDFEQILKSNAKELVKLKEVATEYKVDPEELVSWMTYNTVDRKEVEQGPIQNKMQNLNTKSLEL